MSIKLQRISSSISSDVLARYSDLAASENVQFQLHSLQTLYFFDVFVAVLRYRTICLPYRVSQRLIHSESPLL